MLSRIIELFVVATATASACNLTVAAASDLQPMQSELARALPDCQIRISFASSGTLARQIAAGADFDLFLSANEAFVRQLVNQRHALAASVVPYALGRLALWSRGGTPKWEDLPRATRISIANPALAPYGAAAKQALERKGLWAGVERKLVYGENIRQALLFAETGNVDLAITSWSLVHGRAGVRIPADWHDPITQTAVITARSRNREAAARFTTWLTSPAGQKVLSSHGLDSAPRRLPLK